ncbi:MAG: hypothetical protein K8I03_11705 [Ignavibacteria bacterium]|nr:hypothetical protein [Ignavibacteria bacterium]
MKNAYQILYGIAGLLLLIVLLGGSVTKPVFNNFSTRSLETAGVRKASVDSIDSKIDDMFYTVSKVQLQIEKLKNVFTDKEIDESKFQRKNNRVFESNVYLPLNELVIVFYRISFFFMSLVILLGAVILQLIYRSTDLRRRVKVLEERFKAVG